MAPVWLAYGLEGKEQDMTDSKLRVKAFDIAGERVQLLQVKRWYGWKTLDSEVVPSHALVSLGCFGDTGGWKSKFTRYGSFSKEGGFTTGRNIT